MAENIYDMEKQELPWLIFTLCRNAYAVNSKYVSGILMPPEVTPLPEAADIYKGLVDIRGEVFPLLEIRKLFRFKTIEEECNNFDILINSLKDAHLKWMAELKRCVAENDNFLLAADPAKCDFGKSYYECMKNMEFSAASAALSKIEEPHKLFHQAADTVLKLAEKNVNGNNDEQIKEQLNMATQRYAPIILGLLDEANAAYRGSYRETVVTLSNGEETLGLLVDEVLAVDSVKMVADDSSMSRIVDSRFFTGVGHNDKINKEILIVDEEILLSKAKI